MMITEGKTQFYKPIDPDGNEKVESIMRRIIDEKYSATGCAKPKKDWDLICRK